MDDSPLGSWRDLISGGRDNEQDATAVFSEEEHDLVGQVFSLGDTGQSKASFPGPRASRHEEATVASFGCTTTRDMESTMLRIEEQIREGMSRNEQIGERMLRKQSDVQSTMSKRLDELSSSRSAQIGPEDLGRYLADATMRSVDAALRQFEERIENRLARQEELLMKQQDSPASLLRTLNEGLSSVTDRFEKSSESLRKTVQADLATINGRCEIMTDAVHECNRSQVQAQEELRHFLRRFQQELQFLQPAQDVPVDVAPELQELRGSVEGGFNHLSDRMLILRQELREVYSVVADLPREKSYYYEEQKLPKFDSLGRQSRESLQAERSRQHGGESQHVSAPPSFRASKPSSRPNSSGPVRPPSGGGSSPRRASGAGLPASESVGGQQTETASAADEEELAAPPATLTPVALAAAATAAQLERRLREARVSNVSSVPGGPNRRRPHTAGRDRFTRPAHYGNEGSERQSRDENLSLRRGRNK